jgi:hypothetical protein
MNQLSAEILKWGGNEPTRAIQISLALSRQKKIV